MLRPSGRVHVSPRDGCSDRPIQRKAAKRFNKETPMTKNSRFVSAAIALASLASVSFATVPANAAVICKGGIVMRGCIAATKPMIITPAAPVATTTTVTHAAYVAPAPVATTTVARAAYIAPRPVAVTHAGVTRVTPNGVAHAGVTRVRR
jgi:hypothetical protein